MGRVNPRGEEIRRFILRHVAANPQTISNLTMAEFKISRQAAHQHLTRLVKHGLLTSKGVTHSQSYELATVKSWSKKYRLSAADEETAWTQDVRPILGRLPRNVMDIWWYGFSEMFNNAIDHSGGKTIVITIQKTAVFTSMTLLDDG
jgi:DNA-binding transcriptional ArsR family regulator